MTFTTFSSFNKIFASCHLLSKILRFITTANITSSINNFNEFSSSRVHFFILNNIICITIRTTSKAPCLCHLYTKILFTIRGSRGPIINIIFHSRFKKVEFNVYVYIHNIFAKTLLSLVICS